MTNCVILSALLVSTVLAASIVETCDVNNPCSGAPYYECSSAGLCEHKGLFPILGLEWAGYITITLIMAMCNVAGIGGGAIDQPIMQIFWKFHIKEAIANTKFVITISAFAKYLMLLRQKQQDKPYAVVVDYSLTSVMIGTTIAGAQLGSKLVLTSFPPLLIQIGLEVLIISLCWNCFAKAVKMSREPIKKASEPSKEAVHEKPNKEVEMGKSKPGTGDKSSSTPNEQSGDVSTGDISPNLVDEPRGPVVVSQPNRSEEVMKINDKTFIVTDQNREELKQLRSIADREAGHAQWLKQLVTIGLGVLGLVQNLMLGSKNTDSIFGIKKCEALYWITQVIFVAVCFGVTYWMVLVNRREQGIRKKYNINYTEGEVKFEGKPLYIILGGSFLGGLVCGALGLGGGSVNNPILISLGVPPKVASCTGMYLVFWSSLMSVIVYQMEGYIQAHYALFIALWVVFGSIAGNLAADYAVKKNGGKQTVFVWTLAMVFLLSAGIIPFVAYEQLSNAYDLGTNIFGFTSMC